MGSMEKAGKRIKAIDTMLSNISQYEKFKPVYAEYAAIGWKWKKEKFAKKHREELDAFTDTAQYLKSRLKGTVYSRADLEAERKKIAAAMPGQREGLEDAQAQAAMLRDVRDWINQVLPPDQRRATAEPGKKPSVIQKMAWMKEASREAAKQREPQKQQQIRKKQQDMGL